MEEFTKQQPFSERVKPPKESNISLILNGVGNGMMIGAMPFLLLEMYSHITKTQISRPVYLANAFATVAGSALGGWYGYQEARSLGDYRQRLAEEITKMEARIDKNTQQIC